jgi:pyruvate formate lyase activating enzyme
MAPEVAYFANKCVRCRKCIEVCPKQAISQSAAGEIITVRRHCDNCGQCVEVCSTGAREIIGREMTVEQVLVEVEKDAIFYSNSGGGITLSGGEPTMQPEFSLGILKASRYRGIHTVMETCGYVKWDTLDEMLKYLDMVYMDIKHMSPVEHKKLTAKSNRLILGNARKIAANYPGTPFVIRIPVIPGYNDSEENIASTAKFVRELTADGKIELLPYHKLGIPKYNALLKDYPLPDVETPSEEHLHALAELVKSYDVLVQIGG